MDFNEKRKYFIEKLLRLEKKENHYSIIPQLAYDKLINEIEEAKAATKKSSLQYRRIKRFNVLQVGETKKLVTNGVPTRYYLPLEGIYDVLDEIHKCVGHVGRDRMRTETAGNYANITIEMIRIFLAMCETCQHKKNLNQKKSPSEYLNQMELDHADFPVDFEETIKSEYSTMDFENETTFEELSNTIDTLELEKDKDLPALTCLDLFPDPPHMIAAAEETSKQGSLADEEEFIGFKTDETKSNDAADFECITKDLVQDVTKVQPKNPKELNPTDKESPEEIPKSTALSTVSVASAPVSPASYFSSAESVASTGSTSKKSKKRYCRQCDQHFRKTRDLHEHLKMHISMPEIRVERLSDENEKVKEYLSSLSPKRSPTHGSLKLKFKLLGSQNFEVVQSEKEGKPVDEQSRIRVLKAADIRCKPEIDGNVPLDPYAPHMSAKLPNSFLQPENRYFECPTFDGLDGFVPDDVNNTGEATEDLLKKLLENKDQQSFQKEGDWPANANEFISIDSLAPRCNVCHMNFSHPKYLYEHKQITGHDLPNRMMGPIPTSQPNYMHHGPQNNFMHPSHPPPQNMPPLYQMAQMRGNFPCYGPRMNVRQVMHHHPQPSPPPGFNPQQCMMTRTPPPLYRMNGNPGNFPPNRFHEKRPDMYGPGHGPGHGPGPTPQFLNGNQQQMDQEIMRQPIFLKSRLQKAIRGRAQGPTTEMPPSPGILSEQTAIRPKFLGPNSPMPGQMQFHRIHAPSPPKMGEPPAKKMKSDSTQRQFTPSPSSGVVSPGVSKSPGMPVIQSVRSGANVEFPPQLPEKQKEAPSGEPTKQTPIKNPKDVASMLINRGITVTHKGKTSFVSMGNKFGSAANASAQEAVQKLQANNSVSIISKKKTTETNSSKLQATTTKFLSCPVITCKEKFLTVEGVNRHAFRWHGIPMPNPDRSVKRVIRCKICHQVCTSLETLREHIRREHEPSVNEIGIPIVDLRNDEVKRKLAGLGIFNYVPLTAAGASTSSLAFPIVSVQGASNPSICNLLGLGASSVLSLGPVKSIAIRKPGAGGGETK